MVSKTTSSNNPTSNIAVTRFTATRSIADGRKIKCLVVEVPVDQDGLSAEVIHDSMLPPAVENRVRPPARDLVPWADPYIVSLIHKLQDEVRAEREKEQCQAVLVRQESAGDRPLAELLVDTWQDDAPLAHEPFESDDAAEYDFVGRPHQPR